LENCRILAKSIAEQLGISRERVGSIIHEDLDKRKLSAKWVLKCLNADQRHQRCQSSEQILELFRRYPNDFLPRLLIMDETWLYHYDSETKQQTMKWRHSRLSNFWNLFRCDPNDFLPRLLIMDETWLYHYDSEIKQQTMKWRHSRLSNFWNLFRRDPNDFLPRLLIMDETLLYHYDSETKQQTMKWRHSGSPRPKKFRVQKSA